MNDVKLPILKPGELIKALEKLGSPGQESQKEVISDINILMEEKQRFLSMREKTLVEAS